MGWLTPGPGFPGGWSFRAGRAHRGQATVPAARDRGALTALVCPRHPKGEAAPSDAIQAAR